MILPTLKFLADEFSKYVDSKRDQATADAGGSLGLVGNAALLFDAEQESTIKDKVIFTLVNLEEVNMVSTVHSGL